MAFDGLMEFESALTIAGEGTGPAADLIVMHHLDGL
jgi:hypothetical protein